MQDIFYGFHVENLDEQDWNSAFVSEKQPCYLNVFSPPRLRHRISMESFEEAVEKEDCAEICKWLYNGKTVGTQHVMYAFYKDNLQMFRILLKMELALLETLGFTKLDLLDSEISFWLYLSKKKEKPTIYKYLKERYGKYFEN